MSSTLTSSPLPVAPRRRPPRALVLVPEPIGQDLPRQESPEISWEDWYLTDEEDMAESPSHAEITTLAHDSLGVLVYQRAWKDVYAGRNTFFAWRPDQPLVRVSPDVYLVVSPPRPLPDMWETWKAGHAPPRFALEVVSNDRVKEYVVNPEKYAALGVEELVIYDADEVGHRVRKQRVSRLQRYSRSADGIFELRESSDDVVYSPVLEVYLRAERGGHPALLRLSYDAEGTQLVPSSAELALQERAAKEQERAARVVAEAEVARLKAELERLRS